MNTITKSKYGNMIFNDNDVYIGRSYQLYGEYSEEEVKFLTHFMPEKGLAIDVGANIGSITIPLAQKASKGYIMSIEPQEPIYHMLCGNLAINNLRNVKAINRAVSHTPDQVIYVPNFDYYQEANYGGVELAELNYTEEDVKAGICYPVMTVAIDQFNFSKCDLIKIDVEGMELDVLQGAIKTIERCKPFLYVEYDRVQKNPTESIILLDYINSLDYKMYFHTPPLFNKNNYLKNEVNEFAVDGIPIVSGNLFCYPEGIEIDLSEFANMKEVELD